MKLVCQIYIELLISVVLIYNCAYHKDVKKNFDVSESEMNCLSAIVDRVI